MSTTTTPMFGTEPTGRPLCPFASPVLATPETRWKASRFNLDLARFEGKTGGALLRYEALEFEAWTTWLEACLGEEIPGSTLADVSEDDVQFLHEGDMTPPEAAAWMAAEPPF